MHTKNMAWYYFKKPPKEGIAAIITKGSSSWVIDGIGGTPSSGVMELLNHRFKDNKNIRIIFLFQVIIKKYFFYTFK